MVDPLRSESARKHSCKGSQSNKGNKILTKPYKYAYLVALLGSIASGITCGIYAGGGGIPVWMVLVALFLQFHIYYWEEPRHLFAADFKRKAAWVKAKFNAE